jgi:CRISPR/Cas system-associated exonuclease Cas4 (RecB family)
VKLALRCPRAFQYKYVDRIAEPAVAPEARIGKAVHRALEAVLGHRPVPEAVAAGLDDLLDDDERARYDVLAASVGKFAERIDAFRARRKVKNEWVEHQLAVDFELRPTDFFGSDAFFRGVWDAGFMFDDAVLAVIDHKTGPRRIISDFADQLEGYALLAAAHVTGARKLWLGVHFVAEAAMEWSEPVSLEGVRTRFAPRVVGEVERAAAEVADGYEARPGVWCRRCAYRSICPAAVLDPDVEMR